MRNCESHHHACDCREEKVKRLVLAMRKLTDAEAHGHVCCANWPNSKGYPCDCFVCVAKRALKEWEGEFE